MLEKISIFDAFLENIFGKLERVKVLSFFWDVLFFSYFAKKLGRSLISYERKKQSGKLTK